MRIPQEAQHFKNTYKEKGKTCIKALLLRSVKIKVQFSRNIFSQVTVSDLDQHLL